MTKTVLTAGDLADHPLSWPVTGHRVLGRGAIADYVEDDVTAPDGETLVRQYLVHPGAVGIIALDDDDRVALVRQYRHPVRHRLIEPPAGLLDVADEAYLTAARRELAEEVGVAADDWRVLVDLFTTPGIVGETLRVFLARGVRTVETPEGFVRHGEEAHMDTVWASLDDLADAVLAGRLHNPTLVSGVLAAWTARHRGGFDGLRPADAHWPSREAMLAATRTPSAP